MSSVKNREKTSSGDCGMSVVGPTLRVNGATYMGVSVSLQVVEEER